jgi:hypothetical protein
MNYIVIKKEQQYEISDNLYFQINHTPKNKPHNMTYRDIYVDLQKNTRYNLMILADIIQIKDRNKLKKNELLQKLQDKIHFD